MAMPTLLVVDTAYLYFRAFHGVPSSLRGPAGQPVNALRGTLDAIARLVEDRAPTHLACAWDVDWRPRWRVDLLASYKAHRVATDGSGEDVPAELAEQVAPIRAALEAIGIRVVGTSGAEADDVIGTLATRFAGRVRVDVASSDRDFTQLVDDARGIGLITPVGRTSGWREVHEAEVLEAYGVAPGSYIDLAALRGDTSDGIPGVAGIGDRTAARLLARYGDLAGVRRAAALGSVEKGGLTARHAEAIRQAGPYLDVAPRVIAIVRDLDLPTTLEDLALPPDVRDRAAWDDLVEAYGIASPAARLTKALGL
ncbi:5'-3' exonuclease [Raineyella antarctica]|uniref:5'-3' exonuclease n=1 Tax=Raineyella antarctica TaxID=1577474 RepID=A0A1G6GLQ3_9ACTN|nr:5'-3' exonuclease [Raineyella antarctica]SDB82962.1 5'-3' exonuclease [Raineyella antarctica]